MAGDGRDLHAGYVSLCEIVIAAPASAVWSHVLNVESWIYDFHYERVAGEPGAIGEVRHLWPAGVEVLQGTASIEAKDRRVENATALKTLGLVPEKMWYGVMLPKVEAAGRSWGVMLIMLTEVAGGTKVVAIRSKELSCISAELRSEKQQGMLEYQPVAQSRWINKYLPRLKALVEMNLQRV